MGSTSARVPKGTLDPDGGQHTRQVSKLALDDLWSNFNGSWGRGESGVETKDKGWREKNEPAIQHIRSNAELGQKMKLLKDKIDRVVEGALTKKREKRSWGKANIWCLDHEKLMTYFETYNDDASDDDDPFPEEFADMEKTASEFVKQHMAKLAAKEAVPEVVQ